LAGVLNMVGTMWPIVDAYAAKVSSGLYAALASGECLFSFSKLAADLNFIIRSMRKEGLSLVVWGLYVHFGA
ncbi:hypothetical protein BCR34DRAFT_489896, partial [Clohesyomyces aquaticus]